MKLNEFMEKLGYEIRKVQYLSSILYYSDDIDRGLYTEEQHSWLDVSFWNLIWDCGKLYMRNFRETEDVYDIVFNPKKDVPKFNTYKGCIDELKRTCKKGQMLCKLYEKEHDDIISPAGIKQGVTVAKLGLACNLKEFLSDLNEMYDELNPNKVIKTILLGKLPDSDIPIKQDIYKIINTEKNIYKVFNSKQAKALGKTLSNNKGLFDEIKGLTYRDGGFGGKLRLQYVPRVYIKNISRNKISPTEFNWSVITPKMLKDIEKEASIPDNKRSGYPVVYPESNSLLLIDCNYEEVYTAISKGLAKKYNVKEWKKIYNSVNKIPIGIEVKFSALSKEEKDELKEKGVW